MKERRGVSSVMPKYGRDNPNEIEKQKERKFYF